MSLPIGAPGYKEAGPFIGQRWATITPAHAIQKASAVLTFPEEVPSLVVNRAIEAVRGVARSYGMIKEARVNAMLLQIGPGNAASTSAGPQEGTSLQDVRGEQTVLNLTITRQSVRFETALYTRWIAFREQLSALLTQALPVLAHSTTVQTLGLEYIDFFYAVSAGPEDVSLILDNQSGLIAKRAFRKREPFHSHSGWFTAENLTGRNLVNVDLTVADGEGPAGVRRTISVRTFEAEHVRDVAGPRALELTQVQPVMLGLDKLHTSLKAHLDAVLTREAKAMISLAS